MQETRLTEAASTLHTTIRFLSDLHSKSAAFRDFTVTFPYVQELLFVLFPIVVTSDIVDPETELNSRDSALTFNGQDVIIRPLSQSLAKEAPVIRTSFLEVATGPKPKIRPPRRMSSYVLVSPNQSLSELTNLRNKIPVSPPNRANRLVPKISSSLAEELLELIIGVFTDQLLSRKDFPGLGLFLKVPPGFQEHQAYFESFILRNTLSHLDNTIKLDQKVLWEPRVLTNLARFATHLSEAVYEGWFIDGAGPTIDFLANILEYLQIPDVSQIKAVRLCSQVISSIRLVLLRIVLLRLSELDDLAVTRDCVAFLEKLTYWQTVLFCPQDSMEDFTKLFCFLLYGKLISSSEEVRTPAADLWRTILVQIPSETAGVLYSRDNIDDGLIRGFEKLMELDNETFLDWVDDHRQSLDQALNVSLNEAWDEFVAEENGKTEANSSNRVGKRRERLRQWVAEDMKKDEIIRRHETSTDHWRTNIHAAERVKRQRGLQDQQDNLGFNASSWAQMTRELHRPCGLLEKNSNLRWQLDQTEGRNRMRRRLIVDRSTPSQDYLPKRRKSQSQARHRRSTLRSEQKRTLAVSTEAIAEPGAITQLSSPVTANSPVNDTENAQEIEDGFEMVDDPRGEIEDWEDKNRKVMRTLQRGDQVEHVHNVSRIVGLEACEGLLILGKDHFYILDNFFQRQDGEIVNVWQAPSEERDPYLQMISGHEANGKGTSLNTSQETRHWRWDDVLSISKRRFLFRDVAIEVFFVDGRSYLLITSTPQVRDDLSTKLLGKASNLADRLASAGFEESWRMDSVRNVEDHPHTFGSRFASVFAQGSTNPATRRWMKGEISNFHYLMLVNTMAGRTFNDLTQYPVFPWVLADYTSDELDLSNPRSFRDLTKPMGCQTPQREAEFRDRYQSFAEMSDHSSPPFHYGTHYSSAMIVTSYFIRLQPFVQSYLLLQGGSFDHPDRLFYSIEKAWSSASRENMTDVRELIPEFFYLPEFLLNLNGFDFGLRQSNHDSIDSVLLPPWAKGDPKIFIAKHREALESEHVSRNLHHWIDLVFGHKQRGEAALESTNVFHHLSYHGAKNLDTIDDPVERLATIGIIHNFGQTPHQIFQRLHPQREDASYRKKTLDSELVDLTRLPFPLSCKFSLQFLGFKS